MKATIYIPEDLMQAEWREDLVDIAGGCTVTQASGYWRDLDSGEVVNDAILKVEAIFDPDKRHEVQHLFGRICAALHSDGEQAVLIETHGSRGYTAQLVEYGKEVVIW